MSRWWIGQPPDEHFSAFFEHAETCGHDSCAEVLQIIQADLEDNARRTNPPAEAVDRG